MDKVFLNLLKNKIEAGEIFIEEIPISTNEEYKEFSSWGLAPPMLTIPINDSRLQASESLQFDSTVSLSGGQTDSNPSNDRRVETFVPAGSQ